MARSNTQERRVLPMDDKTNSTGVTMTVREAVELVDSVTDCQSVVREMSTLYPEKADKLGVVLKHLKSYAAFINEAIDSVTITL